MIVRIYQQNGFTDHEVSANAHFTVGSGKKDAVAVAGLSSGFLKMEQDGSGWSWKSTKPLVLKGQPASTGRLQKDEILLLDGAQRLAMAVVQTGADDSRIVSLAGQSCVMIGRGDGCDIQIGSRLVSGKHLELTRTANGWVAKDKKSSNGSYCNGVRFREASLKDGDTVDIGLCRLILNGDALTVIFAGSVVSKLVQEKPLRVANDPGEEYPCRFRRSPRLMEAIPAEEIAFEDAPSIGGKPTISWASVLIMPICSVLLMLGVSYMLGGSMSMLYFSVPSTLLGIVMSIWNYRSQCKKHQTTEQLRLEKYGKYLEEREKMICQKQQEQRRILNRVHPVTSDCPEIAAEPARRLWERRSSDSDFMELRAGEGSLASCVAFRLPVHRLSLEEDALNNRPAALAEKYKMVQHCPVVCPMASTPTLGVIGEREICRSIVKNMVVQAATHHSYEDLKIVVLCSRGEMGEWAFTRWLPHIYDDTRSRRYIADTPASAKMILSDINEILSGRLPEEEGRKAVRHTPYYLFICADYKLLERQPISRLLTSNDPNIGVGAIFLYDEIDLLPKECGMILEAEGSKGTLYYRKNAAERTVFTPDVMQAAQYEAFARSMAPIRIETAGGKGNLPTNLSFLQGVGAKRPQQIESVAQWPAAQPEKSMAVPIGVRENGDPFYFDIHEKHHGPHGLVAGMTGSGKSEMVQSWILSMALKFPPEAVSFVLIDFKGTGLILPFRSLPHLAGTISDLDTNITRNLIALENELTRRKALLDDAGVSNISGYLKLYRAGKVKTPLSYLFIVIDEFAEFKVQFPDFMQVINRVFAIGRTLGVHMLLLTQKPSGVVDEKMSANTRFRWCLKVASSADSKEMLGHPDAVRITNPGRAYVQVGEDEVYEQIQSYWSGAPYNPHRDLSRQRSDKISVVDLYGERHNYEPEKTTGFRSDKNEIDAIVEYLDGYTRKNEIDRARNIWTNKLADSIPLSRMLQIAFDGERWNENEAGLAPVVGMLDDPRSQSQYPLRLNLAEDGHTVVYGAPGTGKTTFLQTAIMSLALSYTPDLVHMYLMDFGGGSLNLFRQLPHVGGVARDNEEEKINKLCGMLMRELERRKTLFSDMGLVSIDSYREACGEKMPYIVVFLDNFAPVLQLYPDLDVFFQTLTREGAGYGMYLVATANSATAVSYRVAQNIGNGIALRMPDKGDYSMIVGRSDNLEPENLPGRGLVRGKPPLEFQTAMPADGENERQRVVQIRELAQRMDEKWTGSRPAPIPILPKTVKCAEWSMDGILAGVDMEHIEARALPLAENQFALISGIAGENTTGTLQTITTQISSKQPGCRLLIYDPAEVLKKQSGPAERYFTDAEAMDALAAELMPVLQKRKEASMDPEKEAWLAEQPEIVLVISDLKKCFDEVSNTTIKRLSSIVNLGAGLRVQLLVCGQNDHIATLYHSGDQFTMSLVGKCDALLIGGSFQSHGVFKAGLTYSQAAEEVGVGNGWLVIRGQGEKVRFVEE